MNGRSQRPRATRHRGLPGRLHPLGAASILACLSALQASPALALPQDPKVTYGGASVQTPSATTMLVKQSTNQAIIDWSSFSVLAGQKLDILQPGAQSVLLNRVTGVDPSMILGDIVANGRVFLSNPRGIVFGANSQIDAGGLVATTLGLSDQNFLSGNYTLSAPAGTTPGTLVAAGRINTPGGITALVSPELTLTGSVTGARVGLAAASTVRVDVEGDGLIFFDARNDRLNARLDMLGHLQATGGGTVDVRARARAGFADTVLNLEGVVQAQSLGTRNGQIVIDGGTSGIVAVSGQLDASGKGAGQTGGTVKVLGEDAGLFDGARVDVSGAAGGGTAILGGDLHGTGPDPVSQAAYVAGGATVTADALTNGRGGQIVLWSQEATKFFGTFSARGGSVSGDGGFIETSAKNILAANGHIDASAPHGAFGIWLLDPADVTIVAGNGQGDMTEKSKNGTDTFSPNVNSSKLGAGVIQTALGTANVVVTTSNDALHQAGNLTVSSPITWNSGHSLSLLADNNMLVNAAITNSGAGGISLTSTGDMSITAGLQTSGGAIGLRAGGDLSVSAAISAGAAAVSLSFGQSNGGNNFTISSGAGFTGSTVTATGGTGNDTITLGSGVTTFGGTIAGGGGSDTVSVTDGTNAWTVLGTNAGRLNATTTFTAIHTMEGGSGTDTFTFPANVTSFGGVIAGGSGTETLATTNGANTWGITGANAGTLNTTTTFSGIGALQGGSGNDTFTLAAGVVTFNGSIDGGNGTNTLATTNGAHAWHVTGSNQGTLHADTTFTSIQKLVGGSGNDTFTLDTGVTTFAGTLDGGTGGSDAIVVTDGTNTWALSGANAGTLNSTTPFSHIDVLIGGSGDDTFTLGAGVASFGGGIDGKGGNNSLATTNGNNAWAITAAGKGSVNTTTTFTNMDVLTGGSGTDSLAVVDDVATLTLTDTSLTLGGSPAMTLANFESASVTGGAGDNVITLTGWTPVVTVNATAGNDTVTGNGANTTLVGTDTASAFAITGSQQGTLTQGGNATDFTAVGTARGGAGNDTFTLATGITTFGGTLDGGGGTNTLAATDGANTWSVTGANAGTLNTSTPFANMKALQGGSGSDAFTVASGVTFQGSITGGGGSSTLAATDGTNTWSITGANAGTLDTTTTFSGISTLQGGSGNDTFTLATGVTTFSGSIDGGAGSNTVAATNGTNAWHVTGNNAGSLNTDTTFTSIQKLVGGSGNDTFTLDTGVTTFAGTLDGGTGGSDAIVATDGTNTWAITGANAGTLNTSTTFSRVDALIGGSGDDTFTLGTGVASFGGGIDGRGGNNSLATTNGNNAWKVTAAGKGSVNTTTTFTNMDVLTGGSGTDSLAVVDDVATLTLTDTSLTLGGSPAMTLANFESASVTGGAGDNVITLTGWTPVVTVNATAGNDTVTGNGANTTLVGTDTASAFAITGSQQGTLTQGGNATDFTAVGTARGGAGNDTFTLATGITTFGGTLDGGGGTNTLAATDGANTWSVTGANAGTLNTSTPFANMKALQGGSGSDAFTVASGVTFQGSITGGGGSSTLAATDGTNTWSITGANAGTLDTTTTFSGISTLQGGSGNDTFKFGAAVTTFSGTIDGGAGSNTLTAGNGANTWQLTAANAGSLNTDTLFGNLQKITGGTGSDVFTLGTGVATFNGAIDGGTGGNNALAATDGSNNWQVSAAGTGSVNTSTTFANIQRLTGGSGNDAFVFGGGVSTFNGTIDGGAGTDALTAGNGTNTWQITGAGAGTLNTSTTFTNLDSLTGGSGTDTFRFGAAVSSFGGSINGGAGNNSLAAGNTANTWQISGHDAGSLNGGAFSNVQTIAGGTGSDAFTGTAGASLDGTLNDGGGAATSLAGSIQTGGTQTYGAAVTLTADAALTSGTGNLAFSSTVDGPFGLTTTTTSASGTTSFAGSIGAGTALASLTTGTTGSTTIAAGKSVVTSGSQAFDNVLSAANLTLDSTGGNVQALNDANALSGVVTVSGVNVGLHDGQALTAHVHSTANAAFVVAGALAMDGTVGGGLSTRAGATNFGNTTVSGAAGASVTANGAVTQSGVFRVPNGLLSVTAGTSNINLGTFTNDFQSVAIGHAATANLKDANDLVIASSDATQSLNLNAPGLITFTGSVTGGSLVNQGAGTMLVQSALGYTGGTFVDAGTLAIAGPSAVAGTGAIQIGAQAALDVRAGATVANAVRSLGGALENTAGTGTVSGDVTLQATTTVDAAGTGSGLTLSGAISDGGKGFGLIKTGTGTLTFAGASTYTGTTVVQAGAVQASAGAQLATGSAWLLGVGSELDLGSNQTIGSLAGGGGNVDLQGHTLTAGGNGSSTKFDGDIVSTGVATGGLTKAGNGTFTLAGTNTYAGRTEVQAGTLALDGAGADALDAGALGNAGAVLVDAGATLALVKGETIGSLTGAGAVQLAAQRLTVGADGTDARFDGTIQGTGAVTKTGAGTWTLSNDNSYSGGTQIDAGVVQVGAGGTSGSLGTGAVNDLATLRLSRGGSYTFANAITGTGEVVQTQGQVTLSNSGNAYAGATLVNGGTLQTSGAEKLPDASAVTVASGASLVLGGNETVASLTADGGVRIQGDVTTAGDQTYRGGLTIATTGPVHLTAAVLDATATGNDLGTQPVSITADTAHVLTAQALSLGDVSLAQGGDIQAESLHLTGNIALAGGTLGLTATGTPDPAQAQVSDTGQIPGSAARLATAQATIQQDGGTINVATGAELDVKATGGGSVILTQAGNEFTGMLSVLSGPAFGTAWVPNLHGNIGIQSLVDVAGGTVNVGGSGIEADIVHVHADQLATVGDTSVIAARLPFDNVLEGTALSVPGMLFELGAAAFQNATSFGKPGGEIRVSIGSRSIGNRVGGFDTGYFTVLPKDGARGNTAVFLVGPTIVSQTGGYQFFYDGAGKANQIPVFYNGVLPQTPQLAGALSSVAAVAEEARRDRFEETVRTENVTVRLRKGVIAEVGPGRPATTGTEGAAPPPGCAPAANNALGCQ